MFDCPCIGQAFRPLDIVGQNQREFFAVRPAAPTGGGVAADSLMNQWSSNMRLLAAAENLRRAI